MNTTVLFVTYSDEKDVRWIDAHLLKHTPRNGETWEVEAIERKLKMFYRPIRKIADVGHPCYEARNDYPYARIDALTPLVGFEKALALVGTTQAGYERNKELVAPIGNALGAEIYGTTKDNQE